MMVRKRALWVWRMGLADGFELFTKRCRGRVGGQGTCFEESWPKVMLVTALTSVTVPARGLRLLILLTGAPFSGGPSSHRLGPVSRWIHCFLHPAHSHRAPFPSPFAPDMIATPL